MYPKEIGTTTTGWAVITLSPVNWDINDPDSGHEGPYKPIGSVSARATRERAEEEAARLNARAERDGLYFRYQAVWYSFTLLDHEPEMV